MDVGDKTVSVGCVVAYVMWSVAGVLLLFSWLIWEDQLASQTAWTALALSAAAATATVRCYFVSANRVVRNILIAQARGREYDAELRSVR